MRITLFTLCYTVQWFKSICLIYLEFSFFLKWESLFLFSEETGPILPWKTISILKWFFPPFYRKYWHGHCDVLYDCLPCILMALMWCLILWEDYTFSFLLREAWSCDLLQPIKEEWRWCVALLIEAYITISWFALSFFSLLQRPMLPQRVFSHS